MVAEDIMSTDVITVRPQDQLEKVADLMMEYGHATFPVVDENNSVVGVIGRTHMIRTALPVVAEQIGQLGFLPDSYRFHGFEEDYIGLVPVEKVMSVDPVQVSTDTPVAEVARRMLEYDIGSVPVVDEGKLVGIVSRSDLVEAIVHPYMCGGDEQ